jgi:hypothetical protein
METLILSSWESTTNYLAGGNLSLIPTSPMTPGWQQRLISIWWWWGLLIMGWTLHQVHHHPCPAHPELIWLKSQVYFANDEILVNESESKYKLETMISDLNEPEFVVPEGSSVGHSLKDQYGQVNLTFSDVAHIVVEV